MFPCCGAAGGRSSLGAISPLHRGLGHVTTLPEMPTCHLGTHSADNFLTSTLHHFISPKSASEPTFKMMVDTSISTVMVWGKACDGCPSDSGTPYDATKSSTAVNKSTTSTKFPHGIGDIEGYIFADTINVGSFSVPKGEFLQVTETEDTLPSVSGILGLAFAGTGETTAPPFWKALITASGVSAPEMGVWLSRALETDNVEGEEESAGAFTFGGVNASLYSGNIEFLGLAAGSTGLGFWMLDVTAITVGKTSVSITPNATLTMFDTTLNGIYGPEADVRAIYAAIPGSSEAVETVFQFPCNTTVSVSVSFGGQTWVIDPKDMNQGPVSGSSGQCFGAIGSMTGSQSPSWKFGIPFLRNVYSVFRETPPAIGFAQLSTVAGGTGTPNASISTASSSSSTSSASSSTSSRPVSTGAPKNKSNIGAIAGGVSAGVVVIMIILCFIFSRWRRRRRTGPEDHTVSAFHFHSDVEAPPSSVVMAESATSSNSVSSPGALLSMKRAQAAAVGHNREASNNLVQTPKGLQLSPGTSYLSDDSLGGSHAPSSSLSPALPALPPGAQPAASPGSTSASDPAVLRELQTLRDEVRWLVTERTREDPPPTYM
ncbi:aspartic peptidase domain-containing protein [Mycena epipterygia]|nr:aspartic peptidase domain-containing protein [Mycena epipterygia]